jgi:hypothetical protein
MRSDLLKLIRYDVRRWPGAKSIRDIDNNDDTLAPSTIGFMVDGPLAQMPRALELGAMAETGEWSRARADELLDLLADRLATIADGAGAAFFEAELDRIAKGRDLTQRREAQYGLALKPLQRAILDAERELGHGASSTDIARYLSSTGKWSTATASSVAKSRRALRQA